MMIRNRLLWLFLLFSSLVCAQPDSSKLIIRINGGYADTGSSNGVASLGSNVSDSRNWNVGLTVGLPFGKRWEAGVGFEYWKQKTETISEIFVRTQWDAIQSTKTDVKLIIGKFYMAGQWKLFDQLYFNPMFSIGIGKATTTLIYQDFFAEYNSYFNYYVPVKSDISYKYFAINLAPAFSFYFNRYFALNLETGSFSFATTDWEWDNKQWLANINPAYWKLGIIVTF